MYLGRSKIGKKKKRAKLAAFLGPSLFFVGGGGLEGEGRSGGGNVGEGEGWGGRVSEVGGGLRWVGVRGCTSARRVRKNATHAR